MAETDHTLGTLKELLEEKIAALKSQCSSDISRLESDAKHVADNLAKDSTETQRRLGELNHEAARIATANAANVNRETYDAFVLSVNNSIVRLEKSVADTVPQPEYRAYKEATERALSIGTVSAAALVARRETMSGTVALLITVVVACAAIASAIIAVVALERPAASITTAIPPQIIYVPAPSPPAPTTTTTTTKP